MKKTMIIRLFALALMSLFAISAGYAKDTAKEPCNEAKIKTSAFSFMCQNKIESNLKKIEGVNDAQMNLEDKVVTVKYNPAKTSAAKLQQTIDDLGYATSLITDKAALDEEPKNESMQ